MPTAAARGFDFADPLPLGVLLAGLALLTATVVLTRQRDRPFTSAVVYLGLGVTAALACDLAGVRLLRPLESAGLIERLTELAVIIALFSAGLRLNRALTWRNWRSVAVMLGFVMPLTIAAVTAFASQVMGLSLGAAVLLGAVLAPTDPVLASDVQVGPPGDEDEPEPHFTLTAEAGLNDGLAFPFVLAGLFLLAEDGSGWLGEWALADVLYAVAAGVAIGALGGRLVAALTLRLRHRGLLEERFDSWLAVATVLVVYGATELAGAYGFLAAFTAGLAFRRHERDHEYHGRVHHGAETVEHVGELAIVLLLGSTVTLHGLAEPGLAGWLLVPLLLLVIRPLATLLGFLASGLPMRERLFVGWFGIRGAGSFYYAAVALNAGLLTLGEASTLYWTVLACTMTSIVVHGLTAHPAVRRLEAAAG